MRLLTAGSLVRAQQGEPFFDSFDLEVVLKSIVLLSNDRKRPLLLQFCSAYKFILMKHSLFATFGSSQVIKECGLSVYSFLSGQAGGYRQVVSKLRCGEVDLLIFLRDPLKPFSDFSVDYELLSACDSCNVPIATNVLTAEILLRALDSGSYF